MADAWYRACSNDYFCGNGDFFACAGNYHEQIREEQEELARKAAQAGQLPVYGIALIAVVGVLFLIGVVFICYMASREKKGTPVFAHLSTPGPTMTKATPAEPADSKI